MKETITKEYENDDIVVTWEPHKCIHAKHCWQDLGNVFKPLKRPWVKMDGGTTKEIITQIEKCPSGALGYRHKNQQNMENKETNNSTQVKVIKGGPLMVMGTCEVTLADGSTEVRENRSTYCRCGASNNKPFCDGAHKGIDWED